MAPLPGRAMRSSMFAETIVQNLVAIAEAYAKEAGKSISRVSKEFYGDGKFFEDLKAGKRSVSVDKADAILREFRSRWPDGAEWPDVHAVLMCRRTPEIQA